MFKNENINEPIDRDILLFRSRFLKQKDYWSRKLSGKSDATDILLDFDKDSPYEYTASKKGKIEIVFPGELSDGMIKLSKNSDLSLYILLLAALKTLVFRYSANERITILSPVNKLRISRETINSLLFIQDQIHDQLSFKDVVLKVRQSVLEAHDNQDYPFEKLLEFLFPSEGEHQTDMISTILCSLENLHDERDIKEINTRICFHFKKEGNRIRGHVLYHTVTCKCSEVTGIINHLLQLLASAMGNVNAEISSISFLSELEKNQLLVDFNKNQAEFSKKRTIFNFIEEFAEKTPEATAVVFNGNEITYQNLNNGANRLAWILRDNGVRNDHPVAILLERSELMVRSILAIWKAGAPYIPMDHDYPWQRILEILKDSGTKVLITDSKYVDANLEASFDGTIIKLDGCRDEDTISVQNTGWQMNMNHLSYIIYTSGSTGRPKGVMVEHMGMMNHLQAKINDLQLSNKSVVAQNASHTFDISVWQFFVALILGGRTVIFPNEVVFNLDDFIPGINENQITILEVVPSYLSAMLDALENKFQPFDTIRYLLVTGETVKPGLVRKWFDKYPDIMMVNAYGPTEASDDITHFIMKAPDKGSRIPIGKTLQNLSIYIVDDHMKLCPVGVKGEICVSGVGVGRGYLNNPEQTAERFCRKKCRIDSLPPSSIVPLTDTPIYKTGDLGRWLTNGTIEFFGRKDYQVKIRGFRIELGEIENQLARDPGIKDAVVMVKDELLLAFLVTDVRINQQKIREYLSESLPYYMIPEQFIPLDYFPLTPNGKVDRKALSQFNPSISQKKEFVAPESHLEKQLVKIWAEVLRIPQETLGIDENFFEVGGHSLKAIKLTTKIHEKFKVKLSLVDIFKLPSIRGLTGLIENSAYHTHASIKLTEEREYYHLSSAQERLYVLNRMHQGDLSYNVPIVLNFEGRFNIPQLEKAFTKLISRHETFRTAVQLVDNVPRLKIHRTVPFGIEYHDMQENQKSDVQAKVDAFVRPFNPAQPPLIRVGLIKQAQKKYILLVDMHHIVTDGTSMEILTREFIQVYQGENLSPLKLRYKDYAEWWNTKEQKTVRKKQEKYWLKEFDGTIPVLSLPTDFERTAKASFEGGVVGFGLNEKVTQQLKTLAIKENSTLYMVLFSLFNILLAKISGQESIVVGSAVAGRSHKDLEQIIGVFINSLAMWNFPKGEKPYKLFLKEIRKRVLEAFENQDYPFENLVEKVLVNRDKKRNPLFDVMFGLQNMDKVEVKIPGLKLKPYMDYQFKAAKFDLLMLGTETGKSLNLIIKYNTGLFKKESIKRFSRYFLMIAEAILKDQEIKIGMIEVVTQQEKEQVLFKFNQTDVPYPGNRTIHGLFAHQVKERSDGIALVFVNHRMTYRDLDQRSNDFAQVLQDKGVTPGTIVGMLLQSSLEMIIALLGILKAGGAYLPIDRANPVEKIQMMIKDSGIDILITRECQNFPGMTHTNLEVIDYIPGPQRCKSPLSIANSREPAYLIYTSGTTGKPKGVLINHRNVVNTLLCREKVYGLSPGMTALQLFSYSFDGFVTGFFNPLLAGAVIVLLSDEGRKDIMKIKEAIIREKITHFICVPVLYRAVIENLSSDEAATLKLVTLAGDKIMSDIGLITKEKTESLEISNEYGVTECSVMSTIYRHQEKSTKILIGRPVWNTRIFILGKQHLIQPVGVVGELCTSGIGLANGYLNNPELTAEKFINSHWIYPNFKTKRFPRNIRNRVSLKDKIYKTGDLGRWMPCGCIELIGRMDHQVKIRGFRIETGEIETHLLDNQYIKEAVVIVKEDKDNHKHLVAYLVSSQEVCVEEIRENLARYLPYYMIPAYFIQLEELPVTANGKIDLRSLPAPDAIVAHRFTPPAKGKEMAMQELWSQVLGIDKNSIGIESDFFHLGGNSLKATILAAKIHKEFNTKITLQKIFEGPTIRKLSLFINRVDGNQCVFIEPQEKKEYYGLSSAQKRLYFLNQLTPGSIGYNVPLLMELKGVLDIQKIEDSFKKLVKRHESLKTSFHLINGQLAQRVRDHAAFEIQYHCPKSIEDGFENNIENQLLEVGKSEMRDVNMTNNRPSIDTSFKNIKDIINNFIRPFDLSLFPLFRIGLILTSQKGSYGGKNILMVDMHHIITDGTSFQTLKKDFLAFYAGEVLLPLKLHYKDYAVWLKAKDQQELITQQETYWIDLFRDELPVIDLPMDYSRPLIRNFAGSSLSFSLSKGKTRQLEKIARENNSTLYMVILSLFNVFLSFLSGQEDIIVGTPVAARRHADLDNIIGMFVNTLPLRHFPTETKTFNHFLKEVKIKTLEAFENQEYQFDDLVNRLSLSRDTSRNPIFDFMFVFQELEAPLNQVPGLKMRPFKYDNKIAKFDLTLYCAERDESLSFSLEYWTGLFKEETIGRFARYFEKIVSLVSADPGKKLLDHDFIAGKEKKQLLHEFNNTHMDSPGDETIQSLFARQTGTLPDQMALVGPMLRHRQRLNSNQSLHDLSFDPLLSITYGELNEKSTQLAVLLKKNGVQPDNIVALMVERSIEMIVILLGILKSGSAYLPIDPSYPSERIKFMLNDSAAEVLIKENPEGEIHLKPSSSNQITNLDVLDIEHLDFEFNSKLHYQTSNLKSSSLAYTIYTSGTTGKPKGVMIEHHSIVNTLLWRKNDYHFDQRDTILQIPSFSFDSSVEDIFTPLISGACILLIRNERLLQLEYLKNILKKHKITHFLIVPGLYRTLLNHIDEYLNGLTSITIAGESFTSDLVNEHFKKLPQVKLVNEYGPTENSVCSTVYEFNHHLTKVLIGKPIQNVCCYIVNKNMKLCPIAIFGELMVSGVGIARGYLNNPELTLEKFCHKNISFSHSPIYKTGDWARWLPDGNIEFSGRIDQQIKIRGFRIETAEIENRLLQLEEIKEVTVIARKEKERGKFICAYYVAVKDKIVPNLSEYLLKFLPPFMIPSYFIRIENIPLTSNGKLNRNALPGPKPVLKEDFVAPSSDKEKLVAKAWKKILGLTTVGTRDNLFEIGGNSINIINISLQLKKYLGKSDIPLAKMFQYPTIASFAKYLDEDNSNCIPLARKKQWRAEQSNIKNRLKQRRIRNK